MFIHLSFYPSLHVSLLVLHTSIHPFTQVCRYISPCPFYTSWYKFCPFVCSFICPSTHLCLSLFLFDLSQCIYLFCLHISPFLLLIQLSIGFISLFNSPSIHVYVCSYRTQFFTLLYISQLTLCHCNLPSFYFVCYFVQLNSSYLLDVFVAEYLFPSFHYLSMYLYYFSTYLCTYITSLPIYVPILPLYLSMYLYYLSTYLCAYITSLPIYVYL